MRYERDHTNGNIHVTPEKGHRVPGQAGMPEDGPNTGSNHQLGGPGRAEKHCENRRPFVRTSL